MSIKTNFLKIDSLFLAMTPESDDYIPSLVSYCTRIGHKVGDSLLRSQPDDADYVKQGICRFRDVSLGAETDCESADISGLMRVVIETLIEIENDYIIRLYPSVEHETCRVYYIQGLEKAVREFSQELNPDSHFL